MLEIAHITGQSQLGPFLGDSMTRRHMSAGVAGAVLVIALFRLPRFAGFFLYTSSFKCPQRKKAMGVRPGELTGRGFFAPREITCCPKISFHSIVFFAKCEGAPSC